MKLPSGRIAFLLTAGLLLPAGAASAGPGADGRWNVRVVTLAGACSKVAEYPVLIRGGQPRYDGPEAVTVTGSVGPNGTVTGQIAQLGGSAQVQGRLSGRRGRGTWTTSALGGCSGHWEARKI